MTRDVVHNETNIGLYLLSQKRQIRYFMMSLKSSATMMTYMIKSLPIFTKQAVVFGWKTFRIDESMMIVDLKCALNG
jgi:hypothetical protein